MGFRFRQHVACSRTDTDSFIPIFGTPRKQISPLYACMFSHENILGAFDDANGTYLTSSYDGKSRRSRINISDIPMHALMCRLLATSILQINELL